MLFRSEESAAGWGLGLWGGTVAGEITDTLDGALTSGSTSRSEERRVGKEGRSRGSPYH